MGNDDAKTYRLQSDPWVRPHHAVIAALADVRETDATEFEEPLYEHLDVGALDALFLHNPDGDVSVTFSVADATVTTYMDDENRVVVEITERTD